MKTATHYFILSLAHHGLDENALWWCPDDKGYTKDLNKAGRYTYEQVEANAHYYDNGVETRAVPVEEVELMAQNTINGTDARARWSKKGGK